MRTEDYLKDLQKQKSLLASALNANGVSAKDSETFDTLVPKVNAIKGKTVYKGTFTVPSNTNTVTISNLPFRAKRIYMKSSAVRSITITSADSNRYICMYDVDPDEAQSQIIICARMYSSTLGKATYVTVANGIAPTRLVITDNSITITESGCVFCANVTYDFVITD